MNWKGIDYRLIRRGILLLELGFVNNYGRELKRMNEGKPGRPFKLNSYVKFIGVVRYLFPMDFRQLEGFTITLHRLLAEGVGGVVRYASSFMSTLHRLLGCRPSTTLGSGCAC